MKIITEILWVLEPFINWVNDHFTIPTSVKKINGDHYYKYRDEISKGMILLANTSGAGSNFLNPSAIKHGGVYFGKGLRKYIAQLIDELNRGYIDNELTPSVIKKIDRLHKIQIDYEIEDEICYVIEATKHGVIPTNLVKFMTTKDRFLAFIPHFVGPDGMSEAAENAVHDLGLPYDYGFSHKDESKYCFEVCADCYEKLHSSIALKRKEFRIFKFPIHNVFTSDTFFADPKRWDLVVNL